MLQLLDLFSGIGGFSLGLERSGYFQTQAFCEIEPFCREVLKKHWPKVPCYDDIRELTAGRLVRDGIRVDAICGGFPCQDISFAGLGAGIEGARSGLWSEYARIIREIRPRIVIVENVSALLSRGMGKVLGDLATLGYDCWWRIIPACDVGLPHERDRTWIIAYTSEVRHEGSPGNSRDTDTQGGTYARCSVGGISTAQAIANTVERQLAQRWTLGRMGREEPVSGNGHWQAASEPFFRRGDDGFSSRMDRLGTLGNAVVPQIPEIIGRAIGEWLVNPPPRSS